jgi:hypothetical protein
MLIFFLGAGTLAIYQVMAMEDRLDEVTRAVDQIDSKVKRAQYEKNKFYSLASDILRLAPKDTNADKIVHDFKLREMQAAQPTLFNLNAPTTPLPTSIPLVPSSVETNAAPVHPSMINTPPINTPSPTAK